MGIASSLLFVALLVFAPIGFCVLGYAIFRVARRGVQDRRRPLRVFVDAIIGAFALIGIVTVVVAIVGWQHRFDRRDIDSVYTDMREAVVSSDLERAFQLMSREYQASHEVSDFRRFASLIEPLRTNRSITFGGGGAWFYCNGREFLSAGMAFELVEEAPDRWRFTGDYKVLLD